MSRLGIALALALAATAASAGDSPSRGRLGAGPDSAKPLLFDARMKGDGVATERLADARHADGGAIVAAPTSGRSSLE